MMRHDQGQEGLHDLRAVGPHGIRVPLPYGAVPEWERPCYCGSKYRKVRDEQRWVIYRCGNGHGLVRAKIEAMY